MLAAAAVAADLVLVSVYGNSIATGGLATYQATMAGVGGHGGGAVHLYAGKGGSTTGGVGATLEMPTIPPLGMAPPPTMAASALAAAAEGLAMTQQVAVAVTRQLQFTTPAR
jgi:hypothetical protein